MGGRSPSLLTDIRQWHQSAMAGIDHTLLNLIVVDSVIEMRRNPELAPRRSVDLWTSGLLQRA